MKQLNLFDHFQTPQTRQRYARKAHGGLQNKKKRKLERPLTTKQMIHVILKSNRAVGDWSFLKPSHQKEIIDTLDLMSLRFCVRIIDIANVGNHLHLLVKIVDRRTFRNFLRSIAGLIARRLTKAKKGRRQGRFWEEGLPYTRVANGPLDEINLRGYLKANRIEARDGFEAREKFRREFLFWFDQCASRKGLRFRRAWARLQDLLHDPDDWRSRGFISKQNPGETDRRKLDLPKAEELEITEE